MFKLVLPDIGEGVVEAEIQKWFVAPGDEVQEDQPLVEVMTDKATVTIPSPRRGTITKLLWTEGQVAKVHDVLLEMELHPAARAAAAQQEEARAAGAGSFPSAATAPTAVPTASPSARPPPPLRAGEEEDRHPIPIRPAPANGPAPEARPRALAAPAVRALARQLGVDLQSVAGSGPGGRVTKEDLESVRHGVARPTLEETPPEPAPRPPVQGADEVVPLRGIRRRIAERMAQSKRTAAHFTFVEEVDVTELVKVKDRIAAAAKERGVRVTFLPFIVKAVVQALKRHPWLNATMDEARGEIRLRRQYHVGVASATEHGLVVPVVRDADRKSLLELAQEIERLAQESKAGRVRPEDVGGSTFTITSLGAQGGLLATPVINYPEVAILGVHRIRATPVVRDGQIVIREMMNISLSSDHRVVDGHVAAAFAYEVVRTLEDPSLLFMELV
jgi:pyruvate dehydrogenase E2 component (dihydrolipoamide acetyltransferase)